VRACGDSYGQKGIVQPNAFRQSEKQREDSPAYRAAGEIGAPDNHSKKTDENPSKSIIPININGLMP
jgi:hypothetical protein